MHCQRSIYNNILLLSLLFFLGGGGGGGGGLVISLIDLRKQIIVYDVNSSALTSHQIVFQFTNCSNLETGKGKILPCLLDHWEEITNAQCIQYLTRMKEIIFSDYRLIDGFFTLCQSDITKYQCGVVKDGGRKNVSSGSYSLTSFILPCRDYPPWSHSCMEGNTEGYSYQLKCTLNHWHVKETSASFWGNHILYTP